MNSLPPYPTNNKIKFKTAIVKKKKSEKISTLFLPETSATNLEAVEKKGERSTLR